MSLGKIYFILVRPQMGENIGSAARAIKNFNIKYLRIVNPRCNWPSQKALATSVGAKDILKSAKIYNSIEKAIGDLDIIFASTSRIRKVNKEIISILDFKKNSGWIHRSQLKKSSSFITLDTVILFSDSTKFSRAIAKIESGRLLNKKKCNLNWCRVETGEYKGWVLKESLWGLN